VNGLRRHVQLPCRRSVFVLALVSALTTLDFAGVHEAAAQPAGRTEPEPSAAALVAARELFRQATEDVDAGRFDVALGKFRRVAAVKETAAVRFNIARCEEQLGKLGAALNDFENASREAAGDPKAADIGKMSQDRANELRPRVPRLTLTPPARGISDDLVVKLDGEKQPNAALGVPLPVDPGHHAVEATSGTSTFKREIDLRDRQSETIAIDFGGGKPKDGVATPGDHPPKDTAPPAEESAPNRIPGFVVLGVGGVLGVTALAFAAVHNGNATDLKNQKTSAGCTITNPNGGDPVCPPNIDPKVQQDLNSLQDKSKRNANIAIGFGIASGVALAVGAYLVIWPPGGGGSAKKTAAEARLVPTLGGAALLGRF
jgi:hypothetical protein